MFMTISWGNQVFLEWAQVLDSFSYKKLLDAWPSFRSMSIYEFDYGSQLGTLNNSWCPMVFSWRSNCMVNELSISYEPVLASSHFPREPLVLGSMCFFKNWRTFWFWFKDFLKCDRTSSPVLDLVLYISRPPLPGSFFKKWHAGLVPNQIQFYLPTHSPKLNFFSCY